MQIPAAIPSASKAILNEAQLAPLIQNKKAVITFSGKKIHSTQPEHHQTIDPSQERPTPKKLIRFKNKIHQIFDFSKPKQINNGDKLFQQYLAYFQTQNQDQNLNSAIKLRLSAIFGLEKICAFTKEGVVSGKIPITGFTLDRLDSLIGMSNTRLAYEFFSQKKSLPSGFLEQLLIPEWTEMASTAGISNPDQFITTQLEKLDIKSEKQVTFESVMEIKNKIRIAQQEASISQPAMTPEHNAHSTESLPLVKPNRYQCDTDDIWFINQLVDNASILQVKTENIVQKTTYLLKKNKREAFVFLSTVTFEIFITGLMTGGIGAAITAITSPMVTIAYTVFFEIISKIKQSRAHKQIKKWSLAAHHKKSDLKNYLKGASTLQAESKINQLIFQYMRFDKIMKLVVNNKKKSQSSIKDHIKYQKSLRSAHIKQIAMEKYFQSSSTEQTTQIRNDANPSTPNTTQTFSEKDIEATEKTAPSMIQPIEDPTVSEHHLESAKTLDHLMIESMQEISRLDYEFETELHPLWEPFDQMDSEARWSIFNEAANDLKIKSKIYYTSKSKHQWIHDTTRHSNIVTIDDKGTLGLSQKMKNAFDNVSELPVPLNHTIKPVNRRARDIVKSLSITGLHIARKLVTSLTIDNSSQFIKHFLSGRILSFNPFKLIPSLYEIVSYKILSFSNKMLNRFHIKKLHKEQETVQLSNRTVNLSDLDIIGTEAIRNIQKFIYNLQALRDHQHYMKILPDFLKQNPSIPTESKHRMLSNALLKRKVLSEIIDETLSISAGHLHEALSLNTNKNTALLTELFEKEQGT